ncbi:MAG: DUF393 domain-containing protein [Pseudomonadota bacterium]
MRMSVYYDNACPLCQREIAFYRRCRGADKIEWIDIRRSSESEIAPGLSCEAALQRFHVRNRDGEHLSGAQAFVALWNELPQFHWLARIGRAPFMLWILERGYRLFLTFRPALQRLVR